MERDRGGADTTGANLDNAELGVLWSLGFAGAGIGWLVGLSATPVVQGVITSVLGVVTAVAAVAAGVKITGTETSPLAKKLPISPGPVAALTVGLAIAASVGTYVKSNDCLGIQPYAVAEKWVRTPSSQRQKHRGRPAAGPRQPEAADAQVAQAPDAQVAEAPDAQQAPGSPVAQQSREAGRQPGAAEIEQQAGRDPAARELTAADVVSRLFDRRYPPLRQADGTAAPAQIPAADASLQGLLQASHANLCERMRARVIRQEYGDAGEPVDDLNDLLRRACPR